MVALCSLVPPPASFIAEARMRLASAALSSLTTSDLGTLATILQAWADEAWHVVQHDVPFKKLAQSLGLDEKALRCPQPLLGEGDDSVRRPRSIRRGRRISTRVRLASPKTSPRCRHAAQPPSSRRSRDC